LISTPLYNKVKDEIWNTLGKFHDLGDKVRQGLAKLDEGVKSIHYIFQKAQIFLIEDLQDYALKLA